MKYLTADIFEHLVSKLYKAILDRIDPIASDVETLKTKTDPDLKAAMIHEIASGNVASFSDGANNLPLVGLTVEFRPIQEGTGDPSPSNIRPITGRTGMTVHFSGADMENNVETFSLSNILSNSRDLYGGTVDLIYGTVTDKYGLIASYNGEELPGEWISDRDVYSPDTTPTVGAQVVYRLEEAYPERISSGSSISYVDFADLLPKTRFGENNIWVTENETVTVEYIADTQMYIDNRINSANSQGGE